MILVVVKMNVCDEVIFGNAAECIWYKFDMNLWTFNVKTDSNIFNSNMEIFGETSQSVKGITFSHIKNVKYLPVKVHKKFPNLVAYNAFNCSVQEIRYENFENLKELQYLSLSYNKISTIPSDAFKDLIKLKFLLIGNNLLQTINELSLQPLENLRDLDFRHNQIKYVPEYAFSYLTELRNISLNENLIESLSDAHFRSNIKLEWIWLYNNKFGVLSYTMFDHMENLKYVDLRYNLCADSHYYSSSFSEMKMKIKNSCKIFGESAYFEDDE